MARDIFFTRRGRPDRELDEEVEGDAVLKSWMREYSAAAEHPVDTRSLVPLTDTAAVGAMAGRVLVVGGEDDVIVDEVALRDAADFWRAAPPLVLPRAPHDVMLATGWEAVFDAVYAWIRDDLPLGASAVAPAQAAGEEVASDDKDLDPHATD